MKQPSLFDLPEPPPAPVDQEARDFAVDPRNDVVLEASAGTGKTRVLVDRYVRLTESGVDPRHILAITFTRKAAAEMRDRVLVELRRRAGQGSLPPDVWRGLRDRLAEIQISTIDAFCFGLLREFPLEADVDPGFEIADETEMARFTNEALDLTLRAARGLVAGDEHVRLLLARVKTNVLRSAIAALLDRRQVALPAVAHFVADRAPVASAAAAAAACAERLRAVFSGAERAALLDDGPAGAPGFRWLHDDIVALSDEAAASPLRVQQLRRRLERHFLTKDRKPRKKLDGALTTPMFASPAARKRHEQAVQALAPAVQDALASLDEHINGLLARGLHRVLAIAVRLYERLLDEHTLLDFAGMLAKSVTLLSKQEEFARSRLKLQSRYHHVLVDEFQDTSRLQWRLIELLVDSWGEGEGVTDAPTSIFIVGDRKQSIYRFRHAEVTLLDEASRKIAMLRPGRPVRRAITVSHRAVPELLAFVNALAESMQSDAAIEERFVYREQDRFPVVSVQPGALRDGEPVLGLIAEPSMEAAAAAVADEVTRMLATGLVRDREGPPRPARPDDIAILFRARTGHQYFETALEARGIRTYVYKGLGFFDAPEVQDLQALIRYLARPDSDLRAAELLRSRLVRLSDAALVRLAPEFGRALRDPDWPLPPLDDLDARLLSALRTHVPRWLALADRITPGELVDTVLRDAAYVFEMRGRRLDQARENAKKVRGLIRRVESRGYATLGRLASYFETLRAGDESNAVIEASGCVNLMTIHAAKGLEFPIVFVVNMHLAGRGRSPGFSVIEHGPGAEPEVAFGPTDATRLEDQRESEELRRLLYVAVTRARDRLYLAGEVDAKARLRRGARSLASLLPAGLVDVFGAAATDVDAARVTWETPRGAFTFATCRPAASTPAVAIEQAGSDAVPDLAPLVSTSRRPVAATAGLAAIVDTDHRRGFRAGKDGHPERLTGTLVHRLFQRSLDQSLELAAVRRIAASLVRPEELVDVDDREAFIGAAAAMYIGLRQRPDVHAALASGQCRYEVPFSYVQDGVTGGVVRGAIDCLIIRPDGVTILEFKTGEPRPEHRAQADVYARAVAAILGENRVNVTILYP